MVGSVAAVEREICVLLSGPCRATRGRSRFQLHMAPAIRGHALEMAHQTRLCALWLVQAHKRTGETNGTCRNSDNSSQATKGSAKFVTAEGVREFRNYVNRDGDRRGPGII